MYYELSESIPNKAGDTPWTVYLYIGKNSQSVHQYNLVARFTDCAVGQRYVDVMNGALTTSTLLGVDPTDPYKRSERC